MRGKKILLIAGSHVNIPANTLRTVCLDQPWRWDDMAGGPLLSELGRR